MMKAKFIRLHDDDRDKICLINVDHISCVYYDWDSNATRIVFPSEDTFSVRESVEEVGSLIERANFLCG